MKRNNVFTKLSPQYLFPEITKRKQSFLKENPDAKLISLGIGDTTLPLSKSAVQALIHSGELLGTEEGYTGYGPEKGHQTLREALAKKIYANLVKDDEIFISDGAKCDIGRLQMLFGSDISIAVQEPAYPVYVEGSLIQGVSSIIPMPCTPENNFFPDLDSLPRTDLIYFCSPNNPTGAASTKQQLKDLIDFAKKNRSIIIFDAAYAGYIQDTSLPKSIYELEGSKEVAIELGSFSKLAGFTGVRLGWTVVPNELKFDDGTFVKQDWNRLMCTVFNGASNIVQNGGLAVIENISESEQMTKTYLENARLLKSCLQNLNYEVYGGDNAPYLWVRFKNQLSWDVFHHFLNKFHLITTPGIGFGPEGEGFIRITAFGNRSNILEAINRLQSA